MVQSIPIVQVRHDLHNEQENVKASPEQRNQLISQQFQKDEV